MKMHISTLQIYIKQKAKRKSRALKKETENGYFILEYNSRALQFYLRNLKYTGNFDLMVQLTTYDMKVEKQ